MAEDTGQEKTEDATPKRKEDSRKKGQIPRSKELNTLTSLLAGGVGMLIFGKQIIQDISSMLSDSLTFDRAAAFGESAITLQMGDSTSKFIILLAPIFILLACTAIVSPISLGGWVFSTSQLAPKMERISLIKGFGRIFSSKSLMELVKALGKFGLVAGVAFYVISQALDYIFILPLQPLADAFSDTGMLFIWCFLAFSSALILVVLIDVPFQIWDFKRQTKMTKQEVKDEMKETDGKPEVKAAIRERQQEFARQRMMSEVPTADVVITNPTHFAVALRYDQSGTGAPKVVAKGQDLVAARIREIASEHGVPLFAAPPLARALYAATDINQEIPGNLFMAVAQVLAYVFQLRQFARKPGAKPKPPTNLSIPEEYTKQQPAGGNA